MAQKTATGIPTIGDVIRAWREFHGLRSTELAALAGVRSQYLSEIEHNRTANPREEFLKKLAVPLKITLRDIYARQMPPEDAASVTIQSSKQGVAGQGNQKESSAKVEDGEVGEEENQAVSAELSTIANPSLDLTDSLLLITFEQIETLIKSKLLSKEALQKVAAGLLDATKLLLKQHEK
jgi:transcriptional regulator with XRE-family HTH domain